MAKEHWYFLAGLLAVLLPLALLLAVKKLQLLETRPDTRIPYAQFAGEPLHLHAFRAQTQQAAAPALLLFHGGRWLYGGPQSLYPQCRYFAARGYHCFSAEYRLGSQNQPDVPGALGDAAAALAYLQDHATEMGIDARRIYAGGGSSGGHLAAGLGAGLGAEASPGSKAVTDPGRDPTAPESGKASSRPAGLVLYNPMLDLSPGTPDHHLVRDHWRAVSPYHHIDSRFPPTLILNGTQDPEVPVASVEAFCSAMRAVGGVCELELYAGQSHGFYHFSEGRNPWFERSSRRAWEFLQGLLGSG